MNELWFWQDVYHLLLWERGYLGILQVVPRVANVPGDVSKAGSHCFASVASLVHHLVFVEWAGTALPQHVLPRLLGSLLPLFLLCGTHLLLPLTDGADARVFQLGACRDQNRFLGRRCLVVDQHLGGGALGVLLEEEVLLLPLGLHLALEAGGREGVARVVQVLRALGLRTRRMAAVVHH